MGIKFADNIRNFFREGSPVTTNTVYKTVYKKEANTWQQCWQRTSADIVRIDR